MIRRPIPARRLQKAQRTIIGDEKLLEEGPGGSIPIPRPAPQSSAADLASLARQSKNPSLRMLRVRCADRRRKLQPTADNGHFSERHPCLRHPPGPRVHPEKKNAPGSPPISFQIGLHHRICVVERIVHVRHWRPESQPGQPRAQVAMNPDHCPLDVDAGCSQSTTGNKLTKKDR